jgi:hypothetical protein
MEEIEHTPACPAPGEMPLEEFVDLAQAKEQLAEAAFEYATHHPIHRCELGAALIDALDGLDAAYGALDRLEMAAEADEMASSEETLTLEALEGLT